MVDFRKYFRKAVAGAFLTAVASAGIYLASTAGSLALTPNVAATVDHFVECFRWMLTDPDTHSANCQPGYTPPHDPVSVRGGGGYQFYPTLTETLTVTNTATETVTGTSN